MAVFKKDRALSVASDKKFEYRLIDYPGLQELYIKRDMLKSQRMEIEAEKGLVLQQLTELSNPDLSGDVEDLLAGKKSIAQLSSGQAKKSKQLQERLGDLSLQESVIEKAIERVKSEIRSLEDKSRKVIAEKAIVELNQHAFVIRECMEKFLAEHEKVAQIHHKLRRVGVRSVPGNSYYTGVNEGSLKTARSTLRQWAERSIIGG